MFLWIRKLKEYGVLKTVRLSDVQRVMTDLIDEDVEVADVEIGENEFLYVFTYVGVIVIAGCVLKCYPKYIQSTDQPGKELRQILKVLEKYNSREQIIRMMNESSESQSFNLLAVLLFLQQDYYENGVYNNTEDIIESNGSGEILWDRTVNETFTLLYHNRPYYIELQTKKRINDEHDYFRRLHACILTKASAELQSADLLEMFEIPEVTLTEEELDDFGDEDYILYQLEKELNTQFITRKQMVLKTMYAYIVHKGSLYDIDCLSMYGTNSFNLVWEDVCADILDNKLDVRLGSLPLPHPLQPQYDPGKKLIDIFDAKYYNARLSQGVTPKGQPGIESVTKQYLYQLAYQRFITDHGFKSVQNCFLMPTEADTVIEKGEVSMQMLYSLGLQNIKVRFLPATMAYEHYITGRKMDLSILNL